MGIRNVNESQIKRMFSFQEVVELMTESYDLSNYKSTKLNQESDCLYYAPLRF